MALRAAPELRRVSLRFMDKAAERRFQDQYLRDNLLYIRAAHVVGIAAWAFFGLYGRAGVITEFHVVLHLGAAIPIVAASLALTYARWYVRVWQPAIVALVAASSVLVEMHRLVSGHVTQWDAVASLMLVLALTYTLLRLQYLYAVSAAALVIGYYTATGVLFRHGPGIGVVAADIYLGAFAVVGTAGVYALERSARVLFLRERQLDRECGKAAQQGPLPPGEHVPRCHQRSTPAPAITKRTGRALPGHQPRRSMGLSAGFPLDATGGPLTQAGASRRRAAAPLTGQESASDGAPPPAPIRLCAG